MGVNGIYGLSGSGLDIESMVKVGMMSKQNEYDKMMQKYTQNEWKKTAYLDLSNQITTFNLSSLSQYKLSSNMKAKAAESSNETAVMATTNAAAATMNHRVDVAELSTNAYLISSHTIDQITSENVNNSKSILLRDIFFKDLKTETINVERTDFASSGQSLGVTEKVTTTFANANSPTITKEGNTSTVKDSSGNRLLTSSKTDNSTTATIGNNTLNVEKVGSDNKLTINGKSLTISNGGSVLKDPSGFTTDPLSVYVNNGFTLDYNQDGIKISTDLTTGNATVTVTNSDNTSTIFTMGSDGKISSVESKDSSGISTGIFKIDDGEVTSITSNSTTYTQNMAGATVTKTQEVSIDESSSTGGGTLAAKKLTLTTTTKYEKDSSGNITSSTDKKATYAKSDGTTIYSGDVTESSDGSISFNYNDRNGSNTENVSRRIVLSDMSGGNTTAKIYDIRTGIVDDTYKGKTTTGLTNYNVVSQGFGDATDNYTKAVSSSDTAIAFTIGDGTNETNTISFTYNDLLAGSTSSDALTINDLVSKINTAATGKDVNVRASYDTISGSFYLYNTQSGAQDKVVVKAVDGLETGNNGSNAYGGTHAMNFFNNMNLLQSKGGQLVQSVYYDADDKVVEGGFKITGVGESGVGQASGSYGRVSIDGVEYNKVKDNKITVVDVTYNFLNTTGDVVGAGGNKTTNPVTVSITQDTEGIVDKVKSFIESYNKILASLYEKYDEKPDSNYKPLTQAQKDSMKDEQIEKWEEKAKQGMLYHDPTLRKIIDEMRDAISQPVDLGTDENGISKTISAYTIGISTTGIKGQLKLDEEKLRAYLNEDGEAVYKVFARLGNVKDEKGNEDTRYNGIAQRLGDIFTNATKSIKTRAGSTADIAEDSDLNNLLRELQTKMSNFKKMMDAFEDKLYKKYDAMEAALAKLGTQLNYITGSTS